MDPLFLFRLLLTFFTGTAWLFLSITAGKRSGSNLSGFIAGLPSTALLVFFFIGLSQSPGIASEATTVFPLSYSMTGLFLLVYAKTIKKGLFAALSTGLGAWFAGAALLGLLRPGDYLINLLVYLAVLPVLYRLLIRTTGKETAPGRSLHYSVRSTLIRSVFGGIAIAAAVFLSRIGGAVFGGIFSAFPAMFISTLVIAYRTYGENFSRKLTRPLLLTGMISIVAYSIGVRYFYPESGLVWGTIFSLLLSLTGASVTLTLIRRKII